MDKLPEMLIGDLLSSPIGQKIAQVMDTIAHVQRNLFALAVSEDSGQLKLLKIGTVFQIFLVETLASGKKPEDLSGDDWRSIAEKVSRYAILEDGQRFSEFVFGLYADYIDLSAKSVSPVVKKEQLAALYQISKEIRHNTELLRDSSLSESVFVDNCLWLSLEAMVKLLSLSLASALSLVSREEYAQLAASISQLAFEYGRYMLYAKEHAILESYIQNQHDLDAELQARLNEYLAEVQKTADEFRKLVDDAFSPELHGMLQRSAALARAAGVKEEDLLSSTEEIDRFFLE